MDIDIVVSNSADWTRDDDGTADIVGGPVVVGRGLSEKSLLSLLVLGLSSDTGAGFGDTEGGVDGYLVSSSQAFVVGSIVSMSIV